MLGFPFIALVSRAPSVTFKLFGSFNSFDYERNWWRLFRKRIVGSKSNIYIFINMHRNHIISHDGELWLISWTYHPVFSGVHVARSLVFYVIFGRSLFILLSFSFGHFALSFFYLRLVQTFLTKIKRDQLERWYTRVDDNNL